jgi:hypothetical protein
MTKIISKEEYEKLNSGNDELNEFNRIFDEEVPKLSKEEQKKFIDDLQSIFLENGVNSYLTIASVTNRQYRDLAISFSKQLVEEYKCETIAQKALAQIAVIEYVRMIDSSYKLNYALEQSFSVKERISLASFLSKELDKSQKQFMKAISELEKYKK